MSYVALSIAVLAAASAVGVATLFWFTVTRVDADLGSFKGFEGIHFEI